MCQQEADETDFAQGSGATGVPCRETEKSVEQIDGHSENSCLQPAECAASREDVGRRGSERDPSEQVKSQAVAREQRVHRKGSVLDFQTAEDDRAGNHQHFDVGIRGITTAGDRKSTRLNSSHTVISYAVFCLKKKKNKVRITSSALL